MPKLNLTPSEFELITRSLRVLAVELCDIDLEQANDITTLRIRLEEAI